MAFTFGPSMRGKSEAQIKEEIRKLFSEGSRGAAPPNWIDLNKDDRISPGELFNFGNPQAAREDGTISADTLDFRGDVANLIDERGYVTGESADEYGDRAQQTRGEAAAEGWDDWINEEDDNALTSILKGGLDMVAGSPVRTGTAIGDKIFDEGYGDAPEGMYKKGGDRKWEMMDEGLDALFTGMMLPAAKTVGTSIKAATKAGGGTGILPNIGAKIKKAWSGTPAIPATPATRNVYSSALESPASLLSRAAPAADEVAATAANKLGLIKPTGIKDALIKRRPDGKWLTHRPTVPALAVGGGLASTFDDDNEWEDMDPMGYESGTIPEAEALMAGEMIRNPNVAGSSTGEGSVWTDSNAKVVDPTNVPTHADTGSQGLLAEELADDLKRMDPNFMANEAFKSVLDQIAEYDPNHPILTEMGSRPGMKDDQKWFREQWRRGRANKILKGFNTEAKDRATRLGGYDDVIDRWKQDNDQHAMSKREGPWSEAEKERFIKWYKGSGAAGAMSLASQETSPYLGKPVIPSSGSAPEKPPFTTPAPDLDNPDANATTGSPSVALTGQQVGMEEEEGMDLGDYGKAAAALALLTATLGTKKGRKNAFNLMRAPRETLAGMPGLKQSQWAKDILRNRRGRITDHLRTVTTPRLNPVESAEEALRASREAAASSTTRSATARRGHRVRKNPGGDADPLAPAGTDPTMRPPGTYPPTAAEPFPTTIVDPARLPRHGVPPYGPRPRPTFEPTIDYPY
jgi:hypothetical protein